MREIEVLSFRTIAELAERLPIRTRYFLLLLAWDAPEKTPQQLMSFFRPLVDRGLVYFCAWGSRCEAVHDAVDQCDIQKHHEAGKALCNDSIVMTTWHARESLQEALWFFKTCAMPAESFDPSNCDRFAVAVGNLNWGPEMEKALQSIEGDADDEDEPLECDLDDV
jgi:hypothetical protein